LQKDVDVINPASEHVDQRPHETLDGKPSAGACGIKIDGKNKWKTLIQNISKKQ
jgi:hypothetical protein